MSGLSFLAPVGLIALIGVPLIVLLYMRTTTPGTRKVPATRFWMQAVTPPSDTRRFRPPPITPLFLIHLAVAVLLAVALARPASASFLSDFGSRTQPKHLILVVDGSTSMSAIVDTVRSPTLTRFQVARERIDAQLGDLQNGDIVTVLLLGTQIQTFQASDTVGIADLNETLQDIALPGGRADFNAALRLCQDLLLPGMDDEIVLITDGATAVDPAISARIAAPITMDLIANTGVTDNLAITEISARGAADDPGRQDLFLRVVNFSGTTATTTVAISADSREISTIDISLEPGGSRLITQRMPAGSQRAQGRLTNSTDAQPADDEASLTLAGDGASGLRVTYVSDAPSDLLRALQALPDAQVTVLTVGQYLATEADTRADLVVFEGSVPEQLALPRTPMLIVNPGADFAPVLSIMANPTPVRVVAQSPLLAGVDLAGVTFGQTPAYQMAAGDSEIVGGEDGPLLYQSTSSNGQPIVVMPFDVNLSNFPQRVSFPILIANAVSSLVARSMPASLAVGDPLVVTLRVATTSATLIDTNMRSHTFALDDLTPLGLTHQLTWTDTGQQGLYQLQEFDAAGAQLATSLISVNAGQVQESNLAPNPLLGQSLVSGVDSSQTSAIQERMDLWPIALLAVLGLLGLDWLISLRNQRRLSAAGATA